MDGAMKVIDLGTDRYDPTVDPDPPRPPATRRQLRTAALALAGVLVFSVGGAAPVTPRLEEIFHTRLGMGQYVQLTSDRVFVAGPTPDDAGRRVVAYDLERGRQLWSTEYPTRERPAALALAGGLVLVVDGDWRTGRTGTTALDARTGRWRWSIPSLLDVPPGEQTALITKRVFPAGSLLDPNDLRAADPEVYLSAEGRHTAPPLGVTSRAIDLDSGRELWALPLRTVAIPVPALGSRPAVVLAALTDGGIEVRDLRTGAVRQRLDWAGEPPRQAELVGNVLVLWNGTAVTAYSADLLQPRWTRPVPAPDHYVGACGPMVCMNDVTAVQVVDPATGAVAWRTDDGVWLQPGGPYLVESDDQSRSRRAVDPGTGRTRVDLTGWSEATEFGGDLPLLLRRRAGATLRTWFGIVDPGGTVVRALDPVPYVLPACQIVPGMIACRTELGDTRVWRYR